MRAFTTYRHIGIALILVIFTISYVSCSDTGINIPEEDENIESMISESAEMAILALGFNPEGAKLIGDYYLVEGDIGISKSTINEGINACNITKGKQKGYAESGPDPLEQWAVNSTVININKVDNITYSIDGSIMDQWRRDLIEEAVAIWNDVNSSRLELSETSNNGDIVFYALGFAPTDCLNAGGADGRALYPENGNPGAEITISNNLLVDRYREVVVHELGHAFGFRHTDWQEGKEDKSGNVCSIDFDAFKIANTPSSDPNSVMNILFSLPISSHDETALTVMYPTTLSTPDYLLVEEIDCISYGGGQFYEGSIKIKFPAIYNAQSYRVELKEGNQNWNDITNSNFLSGYENNGVEYRNYWFDSMQNPDFPKRFRVQALNYAGDFAGAYVYTGLIQENDLNCAIE